MIIVGSASDFLYEENKVAVVTFFLTHFSVKFI